CVLFEMCAGRPPFAGARVSDTLAAVIEREPDWALLGAGTPPAVVRVLRRCLTKDPKLRLRDIGEARIALTPGQEAEATVPARPAGRFIAITLAVATLVATLVAGLALWGSPGARARLASWLTPSATPVLFHEPPPPAAKRFYWQEAQIPFALSPDG